MSVQHTAHDISNNIRTDDVRVNSDIDFEGMLLSEHVFKGLVASGYKKPSPIQLKAIPLGRCGFDLIIQSKSGTGKTLVFGVIALEALQINNKNVQIIILAPTREIAVQIYDVLTAIGSIIQDFSVHYFIGGLPIEDDIKKLKNCQIAIGAPGRMKHLIESGNLKTKNIKMFILDEADKLIQETMVSDVDYIFNKLPKEKQVLAASATYPNSLESFISKYMRSPVHVNAGNEIPVLLGLRQFVSIVPGHNHIVRQVQIKTDELTRIISTIPFKQCLVFCNYQNRAESISNKLNQLGWPSVFITGSQSQIKRLKTVKSLKEFKFRILLTTDLTARGIDVENVNLVINFDIPYNGATYLHRIGRAGRYGSQGISICIVAEGKENEDFSYMLSTIGGDTFSMLEFPNKNSMPENIWNCDDAQLKVMSENCKEIISLSTEMNKENLNNLLNGSDSNNSMVTKASLANGTNNNSTDVSKETIKQNQDLNIIKISKKAEKESDVIDLLVDNDIKLKIDENLIPSDVLDSKIHKEENSSKSELNYVHSDLPNINQILSSTLDINKNPELDAKNTKILPSTDSMQNSQVSSDQQSEGGNLKASKYGRPMLPNKLTTPPSVRKQRESVNIYVKNVSMLELSKILTTPKNNLEYMPFNAHYGLDLGNESLPVESDMDNYSNISDLTLSSVTCLLKFIKNDNDEVVSDIKNKYKHLKFDYIAKCLISKKSLLKSENKIDSKDTSETNMTQKQPNQVQLDEKLSKSKLLGKGRVKFCKTPEEKLESERILDDSIDFSNCSRVIRSEWHGYTERSGNKQDVSHPECYEYRPHSNNYKNCLGGTFSHDYEVSSLSEENDFNNEAAYEYENCSVPYHPTYNMNNWYEMWRNQLFHIKQYVRNTVYMQEMMNLNNY